MHSQNSYERYTDKSDYMRNPASFTKILLNIHLLILHSIYLIILEY